MSADLVLFRDLDGHKIGQRREDGFINATALCKAAGKEWYGYARTQESQAFLAELQGSPQICGDPCVVSVTTGPNDERGTWVHPDVAIHLAQWCSPRFAVQVSRWVRELITAGRVELVPASGDDLLDSITAIQRATTALAETRRRQVELERAQAETRALAEQSVRLATAALDQSRNNHGRMQLLGYARLIGLELTESQASHHGREVSRICRGRGIAIEKQMHQRYGHVHLYPVSVLEEYFAPLRTRPSAP